MSEQEKAVKLMQRLRKEFRAQIPEKLHSIQQAYESLRSDPNPRFDDIRRLLHNLVGAGGTYGFPEVTELAITLQKHFQNLQVPSRTVFDEIVEAIRQAVNQEGEPIPQNFVEGEDVFESHGSITDRIFYFSECEDPECLTLISQLQQFHLQTVQCQDVEALRKAIESQTEPCVMMISANSERFTERLLAQLPPSARRNAQVIVMLLSDAQDIQSRLLAAQSGVDIFLNHPVSVNDVIDSIERMRSQAAFHATRVLIIDDEKSVSRYHEAILVQAGMKVRIANDVSMLDQVLQTFSPEIILLDMYMPQWSGIQIAKALRQLPQLLDVPIVFLSAENKRELQLDALQHGGDDFLTKPIKPEFLVESIRVRAKRYRDLRRVMLNDGLTQVFNRRSIMQMLDREMLRAKRQKSPVSIALIDVDHFKKINDTYGHLVGDFVLKTLTQLLRQRIRGSDLVGRYGGEEFLVILPDTGKTEAYNALNEIRETFQAMEHHGEPPFSATFSGGIAEVGEHTDKLFVVDLADKALYAAKTAGRNRLLLSE